MISRKPSLEALSDIGVLLSLSLSLQLCPSFSLSSSRPISCKHGSNCQIRLWVRSWTGIGVDERTDGSNAVCPRERGILFLTVEKSALSGGLCPQMMLTVSKVHTSRERKIAGPGGAIRTREFPLGKKNPPALIVRWRKEAVILTPGTELRVIIWVGGEICSKNSLAASFASSPSVRSRVNQAI